MAININYLQPNGGLTFGVIAHEYSATGHIVNTAVTFHETRKEANRVANDTLNEAHDNDTHTVCYVFHCTQFGETCRPGRYGT